MHPTTLISKLTGILAQSPSEVSESDRALVDSNLGTTAVRDALIYHPDMPKSAEQILVWAAATAQPTAAANLRCIAAFAATDFDQVCAILHDSQASESHRLTQMLRDVARAGVEEWYAVADECVVAAEQQRQELAAR